MYRILLLASCLSILTCPTIDAMRKKLPVITGDEDDNELWMPDVRNTVRIGPAGTTAAEFVVGSGVEEEIASDNRRVGSVLGNENKFAMLPQRNRDKVREATPCSDPTARSVMYLFERENYSGGMLVLTQSAPRMGTDGFPTSSARIDHAPGRRADSCCWELFDRAGFAGRMLRLCPGSYSRSALRETISAAVKSARLVENPKTRVRRQRARFNEVITPEEARFGALFHHLARSRLYYAY